MFAVTQDCPALIDTPGGPCAAADLTPGAYVSLARGGIARIAWVGHRRLLASRLAEPALARPIAVTAGALGDGTPHRDLLLSPDHAIFVGLFVPVAMLVNGRTIRRLDLDEVRYTHIELDHLDAVLAEGVPAETYVDLGNRSLFANRPLVTLRPRLAPPIPETFFTPSWLAALRARLDEAADQLSRARGSAPAPR